MNTRLELLFEKHNFSTKDRYDFLQIYELLPAHKRVNLVENFDEIALKINQQRTDLYQEHEILFWESLSKIENKISQISKKRVVSNSRENINLLKETL